MFCVYTNLYNAGWNVWFYQEFNSLKKVAHEMKPLKKVAHEMKPLKEVAHEVKRPKSCTVRFAFSIGIVERGVGVRTWRCECCRDLILPLRPVI